LQETPAAGLGLEAALDADAQPVGVREFEAKTKISRSSEVTPQSAFYLRSRGALNPLPALFQPTG